mgnify:CR=1 FL=1
MLKRTVEPAGHSLLIITDGHSAKSSAEKDKESYVIILKVKNSGY